MPRTRKVYRLVDVSRGQVIATGIHRAAGWWERLLGLMGRREIGPGAGLLLDPCNGVHTFGMRFPIDLLVLDREGRVLRILTGLKPWRISLPVPGGRLVVELTAGMLQRRSIRVGDLMRLEEDDLGNG